MFGMFGVIGWLLEWLDAETLFSSCCKLVKFNTGSERELSNYYIFGESNLFQFVLVKVQ